MVLAYMLLGIALLGLVLLVARWFARADPKTLVLLVKWVGGTVLALVLFYLVVSGRAAWAIGAVIGLLPFVRRLLRVGALFRAGFANVGGRRRGGERASNVETAYLAMTLDHETGEIDGMVLKGAFEGRRLSNLSLDELLALLGECARADPASVPLVESFLDRGPHRDWRERMRARAEREGARTGAAGGEAMTVEEAREILGVAADASPEEIRRAHRLLMQKNHPDHGGSTYLAAKINRAKEVLLGA